MVYGQVVGLLGLLASALFILVGLAVGLSYHPEENKTYLAVAVCAGLTLALGLGFYVTRWRRGPLETLPAVICMVFGVIAIIGGLVLMAGNPGDWPIFLAPVAAGLGLVCLGFESPKEESV